MEMASLWRSLSKPIEIPRTTNATLWRTLSKSSQFSNSNSNSNRHNKNKLRKCSSLKVATSFTRVCLCAPISSYTEVFQADVPPRRSNTYPRTTTTKPMITSPTLSKEQIRVSSARISMEGRRIFRGKSLTDDVLMRRFVVEEEAMWQVRRRNNQMEAIRRRSAMKRRKIGPSPLSRMVLAKEECA